MPIIAAAARSASAVLLVAALGLIRRAGNGRGQARHRHDHDDLADIARAVAGDLASVTPLAAGTQDAHFVDAKPSTMLKARAADLFIEVGMASSRSRGPALSSRALANARDRDGQARAPRRVGGRPPARVPSGTIDRAMGDVHRWATLTTGWIRGTRASWRRTSPRGSPRSIRPTRPRVTGACRGLPAARVSEAMLRQPLADALRRAARAWKLALAPGFPRSLDALRQQRADLPPLGGWARAQMAPFQGQRVFTHHRSWSYLLAPLRPAVRGEIEPKPGIPAHAPGISSSSSPPARPASRCARFLVEPYYNASGGPARGGPGLRDRPPPSALGRRRCRRGRTGSR